MSYKILEANEMHFKTCTKCGETLPATTEYFYKNKCGKYGLESICKKCKSEYSKQHYEDNRDKISERHKQYREKNRDKRREYSKQYREKNKDKIAEQRKQHYENNKDKIAEQQKKHYEDNRDKILEQCKQYREKNRDKRREYSKQWYEDNRDKRLEQCKQYRENNKDKIAEQRKQYYSTPQGQAVKFNCYCRRRTKEQNQGNGITKEQWLECMKFFNWKCAYSGQVLSKDTRSLDHIIPLNNGGKHEIWNLVPMYRTYNISKHDKDMEEWYQEQDFYSEERLQKIYEWQEYAYNKYSLELEKVK